MQRLPTAVAVLMTIVSLVLAGALLRQDRESRRLSRANEALSRQLHEMGQVRRQEQTAAAELERQVALLTSRLAQRGPEPAAAPGEPVVVAASTPAGAAGKSQAPDGVTVPGPDPKPAEGEKQGEEAGGFMAGFAKMMEKPEMREAMRTQQKLMLDMLYGSLFRKMDLAPDDLERLKELLVNRQMAGMEMMGRKPDQAAFAAVTQAQQTTDADIKGLLGDERYKLFEDHQATVGERMVTQQLNQQLLQRGSPLTEAQQEELVTLMVQEREAQQLPTPEEQQRTWMSGPPSEEAMEKLFQAQEAISKRVYERSGEVLSDAQREELKTFQENQIKMQRVGLQMMRGMFGGDKKE